MPGHIFLVDFNKHRVIEDGELKERYTKRNPYGEWLRDKAFSLDDVMASMPDKIEKVPPPFSQPQRLCTLCCTSSLKIFEWSRVRY
jgi:glutamate synthase (NADH)